MADIAALFSVLEVFNKAQDRTSLERAHTWLQDFQHSREAWKACDMILISPDAPLAAKIFAAQTFRAKVTYDLQQVDQDLPALRDTLLAALGRYHLGPRAISLQLCLALAGIAVQMPSWPDPVQTMVMTFGQNPDTVPVLLQFLSLLPEELTTNTKIPVTDEEYRARSARILTERSKQVLELLSIYTQASGVTTIVQLQILRCVRNWLLAGEVSAADLANTPLFLSSFEALASDELFDAAVDVLCELIHETQEVDDNMAIIELIVPRIIALRPQLSKEREDPEKIKGYARIFTEAGETYRLLLLQHVETFSPIVEAIGECSAYPDLDVVPITFPFWMRLAQSIGKKPSVPPLFLQAYQELMRVIIGHLHFPADLNKLTGQEADNFRSFRHVMGDTLKDCCFVLRTDTCLLATYNMITVALSRGLENVSWQEIEAPLFAMRSMGAEVDPNDNNAVPKIMDLLSSLPDHPRVRYAALLIVSRYTEWINKHPSYINSQLQYIAEGFENSDPEVLAAAGQALKYFCQDCKQHLVDFLPTLHSFLKTTCSKLPHEDRRQVYEAIAHVISAMPIDRAAESLRTFAMDSLGKMHLLVNQQMGTKEEESEEVDNDLENLEIMLHVVRSFGDELPPSCQSMCNESWIIFDAFIANYGSNYDTAERTTRVLRHGINIFGKSAITVAHSVMERMLLSFETSGHASYLWVAGKIIGKFGKEDVPNLRKSVQMMYEGATNKVVCLLQATSPGELPDVMEDYLQMLLQLVEYTPDIFFQSPAFSVAFKAAMAALTLIHTDIIVTSLDLFRVILTHDCLETNGMPPSKIPAYVSAIKETIKEEGREFIGCIVDGIVGDFPEDSLSSVVAIFREVSLLWTADLLSWLPPIVEELPVSAVSLEAKAQFLSDVSSALDGRAFDKVKYAVLALNRSSRKSRERRRIAIEP